MSQDLVDRLRLVRTSGIGPVTFRQLLRRFGSASAALEAVPDLADAASEHYLYLAPLVEPTLLELCRLRMTQIIGN